MELLIIIFLALRNILSMLERNKSQHIRGEREGVEERGTRGRGMRTQQELGIYLKPVKVARKKNPFL